MSSASPNGTSKKFRNERTEPLDITPSKHPENDESPFRRWQFGTHWRKENHPALAAFSDWAQRYLAADEAERGGMVAEGATLAQERRAVLRELIMTNPREALASSVPFAVRQQLPAAITTQLEERVSGKGDLLILGTVPQEDSPSGHPAILRRAVIGQERFTAHVFGERKDQRTTSDVSLHGVAIDGQLALSESPVRLLEAEERPVSSATNAEAICSVSGLTAGSAAGSPVTGDVQMAASGNQVHWLCRGGHLEALEHKVRAAESGSAQGSVVASAYQTTGARKILLIMIDFSDFPGGAVSRATAQASLNDVTAFIRSNAYNQIEFTVKDVTPVLRMPRTGASYVNNPDDPMYGYSFDMMQDARTAAASAGYNPTNYDFDIVAFANIGFPWGGLGYVGWTGSWVQGDFHRGVTAHELGHNLGNWHANSWVSSTVIGTNGTHVEYGNPFDVLGGAYNYPRNHHSANFKFLNGWLPNDYLHTVTTGGTYRIYAQDFGGNLLSARKYGIRIPVGIVAGGETMDYWLDFRQGYTGNASTADGAVLKWGNDLGTQSASRLLDTQPATLGNMEDAPLLVGRTFTDAERSLSITTLSKGGSGNDSYLDIQISFGSTPPVTLGEALDLVDGTWLTGGDQWWAGQTVDTHDGADAAASGAINHNQQSFVETIVRGPGTLTFWWKVSSESGYDFLSFLSDGLQIDSISGEQPWRKRTNFVAAGTHTLRWRYSKDGSVVAGSDQGWLDQVSFTPTGAPTNDMFANCISLSGSSSFAIGTNHSATKEIGEPNHGGNPGGDSVWWTWTAPVSGWMRVTTDGSSFDTLLGVYTGSSVSGLTLVAGDDDSGEGLNSAVTFSAVAGANYQIAVDGYNRDSGGIRLNIYPLAPLRLLPPQRLANGSFRVWIASNDGRPLDISRAAHIEVLACTNLAQPNSGWTRLSNSFSVLNGMLFIEDTGGMGLPMRFYRVIDLNENKSFRQAKGLRTKAAGLLLKEFSLNPLPVS